MEFSIEMSEAVIVTPQEVREGIRVSVIGTKTELGKERQRNYSLDLEEGED